MLIITTIAALFSMSQVGMEDHVCEPWEYVILGMSVLLVSYRAMYKYLKGL